MFKNNYYNWNIGAENRVQYCETIQTVLNRIPFLKQLCDGMFYNMNKINKYMGYKYITASDIITFKLINRILQEAEK